MKQIYQAPEAEIVKLNVAEDIMQDGFNIEVSGGTTPEESDSKRNLFEEELDITDKAADSNQSSGWQ